MKRIFLLYTISLICSLSATAQDFILTGKVMDGQENAIELASVSCVAQGKATMTNLRGEFSLSLRSADSVVMRFSMILPFLPAFSLSTISRASSFTASILRTRPFLFRV